MSEGERGVEGEVERLLRRLERERRARQEAEALLARRSLELLEANRELAAALAQLEVTVDERTRALVDLRSVAYLDGLTGLVNRRLFNQQLAEAVNQARQGQEGFSLVFIDVDDFKRINDIYGHAGGDAVLRQIASRLLDSVRAIDTVARVAGDEFAILIPGLVAREALSRLATRVVRGMATPIEIPGTGASVRVGLSIGVAVYPDDATDAEALSVAADIAMYRSKQGGKNRVTFCDELIQRERERALELERDLTRALAEGEFLLVYQPLVFARGEDLRIHSLEALLRWQHPRRGLLDASEFLPFADERGMMGPIGRFVLGRALEDARPWFEGPHPPQWIGVNVSARQLRDEGFFDLLDEMLGQSGLPPECLALDVSEAALLDSPLRAQALARRLEALGICLCIDDFGSVHAGLRVLSDLRVGVLKLARELIGRIPGDHRCEALIETIIGLTRHQGTLIVAEGVETTAQQDFLGARGCGHFQGHLFGPALSAAAVSECLAMGGLVALDRSASGATTASP